MNRGDPVRDAGGAGLPARREALAVLLRVERDGAFADVLLGHRLDAFAPTDRRLVTQLVLGTIAWRDRLDYELARISSRKLDDLDPAIRAILRMGLYQFRMLSRIPGHAAVDTAVTLAREAGGGGAAGFVNAILRNALRKSIELPARGAGDAEYLALAYSHPEWMVREFIRWFGSDEAESLMRANNEAAPNVLRLNPARGSADELRTSIERGAMEIRGGGHFPETVILNGAANLDSDAWRAGAFHLQSEASQMVARMLAPAAGASVIDCAGAPGGKATHLAEMAGAAGRVVILDLNLAGLRNARAVAMRLRHRNVGFARCDAASALPLRPRSAQYVLLDAPCTGIGTLREHPEIRWRLQAGDFARMARLQAPMLENAAALVRPNGVIVYSVCSFAPAEGPELVRAFLAAHRDFRIDSNPPHASEFGDALDRDGFLRTRPDRGGLDGFFAARLIRAS
jgi:16S rRNA (cytosine967-C5)-methyltransferase